MRRTLALLVFGGLLMALTAAPALAQDGGKVTVVHGVPDLTVDVYVNGDLTLEDFEFGDIAGPLDLPAGDYDLAITAADDDIANAVLEDTATVTDGLNASIVAHLQADGTPTITIYANDTSAIDAGNGRLVVRHDAAAPAVDIFADGGALIEGLANPDEAQADVPAASYAVVIAPAGAGIDEQVFDAGNVEVVEGTSRIVYAIGDLEGGSFTLAVQDISGLGVQAEEAPDAVPAGEGALPGSGLPVAAIALALLGIVAVGIGVPAVRRNR